MKCKKCGWNVLDYANFCPKCQAPTDNYYKQNKKNNDNVQEEQFETIEISKRKKSNTGFLITLCCVLCCAIGVSGSYLLINQMNKDDTTLQNNFSNNNIESNLNHTEESIVTSTIPKIVQTTTLETVLNISNIKVGDTIHFGEYDWIVLDKTDDRVLIITKESIGRYKYNDYKTSDWKERDVVTWENCTLRKYLNNEFYNTFSQKEQSMIQETKLLNGNSEYEVTTTDKIFLLSVEEVNVYLSTNIRRQFIYGKPTYDGNDMIWDMWWTRSSLSEDELHKEYGSLPNNDINNRYWRYFKGNRKWIGDDSWAEFGFYDGLQEEIEIRAWDADDLLWVYPVLNLKL